MDIDINKTQDNIIESTQDRIDEINHPNDPNLVAEHTRNRDVIAATDRPRHGLDDDANNDPEKGAALGGLGGAAVGAAAGSIAGPVGTLIGAVAGGLVGAGASGAAVAAVDSVDNDNTISGVGSGVTLDSDARRVDESYVPPSTVLSNDPIAPRDHGHNIVTGGPAETEAGDDGLAGGAVVGGVIGAAVGGPVGAVVGGTLGSLAGGVAGDAAEAADEENLTNSTVYSNNLETNTAVNPGIYNPGTTATGAPLVPPLSTPMADSVVASDRPVVGDQPVVGNTMTGDGHNIVTGGPATTEAGDDGLAGGAVVGGVVGAAVGGPVGAVVGGTLGSLAGGVAGDAAEAAADEETRTDVR